MTGSSKFRGSVFISYRRADTPGYVRALMSELRAVFGSRQIFLDMEDIEAGTNFPYVIDEAVSQCELLLVVIGRTWLEVCNATGQRRLECTDDFVRLEILSGLRRQIPTIPILIDDAVMPAAERLPEELRRLSELQAVALSHERWDDDIKNLIQAIERVTVEPGLARQYASAVTKLDEGYWREALVEFDAIQRIQKQYLDVAERSKPLRALAARLARMESHTHGWRRLATDHALFVVVVFSLLPNMLAALFNYSFNWEVIVAPMLRRGIAHAADYFRLSVMVVNAIGFPLGIGLLIYLAYPVTRALAKRVGSTSPDPDQLAAMRKRLLLLGHYAALIGVVLWIVAGPVYPLMIGTLDARDYVYFIVSLSICGILSATYPFLTISWLAAEVLYLPLLRPGPTLLNDLTLLDRLDRLRWRYLWLAGALPLLIVTAGLALGPQLGSSSAARLLALLGLVGFAGFILAVHLFRALQSDSDTLRLAVSAAAGNATV